MRVLALPIELPWKERPYAGIFVLRCVEALRDLGHDVEMVRIVPYAPPFGAKWRGYGGLPDYEEIEGVPVRTIRALIAPRRIGMEYLPMLAHGALQREIARFRPDVLHAHFLIPSGHVAVHQAVPTVVTAHGSDAYRWPHQRPGLYRAAREAIVRASRVTAVSGYIRDCVRSIAQREVDVIWNGADERFFHPRDRSESRIARGLPADRFVIAFAGNVLRPKGLFDLVEAAAALHALQPIVAVAGTGADAAALRASAQQRGVDLRLLGQLEPQGIGELFGAADVVTLPSYHEGLPSVVCEALLSASAVVASTAGGIPEIVEHERTGLLVAPGDVAGLAAAFERLAAEPALRERLARAAHEFAARNLTWRVSARRYARVYAEMLNAG